MKIFVDDNLKPIGPHSLKVYNKDGNIKLGVDTTEHHKIIRLYKYEREFKHIHSYTITIPEKSKLRFVKDKNGNGKYVESELKFGNEILRDEFNTFYDYIKMNKDTMVENIRISNARMEHWELVGDMEEIKTETVFESGNIHQTRKKMIEDQLYITTFYNGEMTSFKFSVPENKIDEYLEKLKQE